MILTYIQLYNYTHIQLHAITNIQRCETNAIIQIYIYIYIYIDIFVCTQTSNDELFLLMLGDPPGHPPHPFRRAFPFVHVCVCMYVCAYATRCETNAIIYTYILNIFFVPRSSTNAAAYSSHNRYCLYCNILACIADEV